jgi:hypothetical protein
VIVETIGSLALAAIAGGVGWAATEFVARPVRRFFDLRGEVIRRMAQYADIPPQIIQKEGGEIETPVVTEATLARAKEAESVIRDLAAQMLSLAYNETSARSILVQVLRYDVRGAAEGLFALSWLHNSSGGRLKNRPRRCQSGANSRYVHALSH